MNPWYIGITYVAAVSFLAGCVVALLLIEYWQRRERERSERLMRLRMFGDLDALPECEEPSYPTHF